jgi:hypothetical protein
MIRRFRLNVREIFLFSTIRKLEVWFSLYIKSLSGLMRASYLPPLMIYMAAGVSGLTGIVGTFFVKERLGLSAEFLAMLGFWAGIPWALKMPLGHLVDLMWRWKSMLVYLGAGLIGASLAIMLGLLGSAAWMHKVMSVEAWFVLSTMLAPLGYVVQDVVADAMTVEAVPVVDDTGRPLDEHDVKLMHTTMQTLGRVAIVGGGLLVSGVNLFMFSGVESMAENDKGAVYGMIYRMAMVIPLVSVAGVFLAAVLRRMRARRLRQSGLGMDDIRHILDAHNEPTNPNWWILGGSFVFALFTLALGLGGVPFDQEIIFAGSMTVVIFLMYRLLKELSRTDRRKLVGTAVIIFVFRALPGVGAGATWWQIDELGFDQYFISILSLISGGFALMGMFIFRRFMAEKSIAYIVGFLTVVGTILTLPFLGLYYGLHEWTSAMTHGVVNARSIALINTALESPLGQVAMIPMLAWIARSAPSHLKATFFAVMSSFTNLALSFSTLGTKYLNQVFVVARQVKDPLTGAVTQPADYSQLGVLLIIVTIISLVAPLLTILFVQNSPLQSR